MQGAEQLISRDMQDTMQKYVKVEVLAEEILFKRQAMIEYDRKRNYNRECLGAFRREEVQSNNKLWMTMGSDSLMVKLPRKSVVGMIEGEQARLNKLIEETRKEIKAKVRELNALGPDIALGDMDPYVVKLLLSEKQGSQKGVIEEEEEEDEEL